MDQVTYPSDPMVRRSYRCIERQTFRHAARILVTTPGTAALYRDRYPAYADKVQIIPNGFDPELFPEHKDSPTRVIPKSDAEPLTLLHSGILYPSERNPIPFLRALATLLSSGNPRFTALRVVFRGSGYERQFSEVVATLGLQDIVSFPPPLPYDEAISEMLQADALLLFQAANCNSQIPAKAYEYLYTGRPVIGITDPDGDTGQLLQYVGVPSIAKLEDEHHIRDVLTNAVDGLRNGTIAIPARKRVMQFSRQVAAGELATLLDVLVEAPSRKIPDYRSA